MVHACACQELCHCHGNQRRHGDVLIELWRHRAHIQPDTRPLLLRRNTSCVWWLVWNQVNALGVGGGQTRDKVEVARAAAV